MHQRFAVETFFFSHSIDFTRGKNPSLLFVPPCIISTCQMRLMLTREIKNTNLLSHNYIKMIVVASINEVNQRWAQLVLRRGSVQVQFPVPDIYLGMYNQPPRSTQLGHPSWVGATFGAWGL